MPLASPGMHLLPEFLIPYLAEIQETCRGGAHSGGQGVTVNGYSVFGRGGSKVWF